LFNGVKLSKDFKLYICFHKRLAQNIATVTPHTKKNILVAPLNWGLGHATRCIPIIKALVLHGFTPIIASDGEALALLRKEFKFLTSVELPSYRISYPKHGRLFKMKMLQNTPQILKAIKAEHKAIAKLVTSLSIDGIISDNRFGAYHETIPSVFMTHQLEVLSGNTTWLSTKMHQSLIKRFDTCWVPDTKDEPNLSGNLGHTSIENIPVHYIGAISRFNKKNVLPIYDLMVVLSGPEPQRTLLEVKLLKAFKNYKGTLLFVKGKVEEKQQVSEENNTTLYNFMTSTQLETAINASRLVISRSGYTTLMDLAKLGKKAFFIPTPGQFEQEYLAERMEQLGLAPFCKQDDFDISLLSKTDHYKGLSPLAPQTDFGSLLHFFKGE